MSTRQVDFKDKNGNKLVGNTTTTAVADVAKNVPLSETLTKVVEKEALGYLPFSVASTYAVGDIVFYANKLYKFTSAKSASAWDPTKVEEYSIKDETDTLAKKDGYYAQMGVGFADVAEDLNIQAVALVEHNQTISIETTGGDESVKDGVGYVKSIKGTTLGITASGAKVVSVGFNLIPNGNGTQFEFVCVKGEWGSYGTATKNNGYLFTDSEGNTLVPVSVKQNGTNVPTHVENGVTYYLPSQSGKMLVTFASSQINPCCHLCWSNYRDTKNNYEQYSASEVSLATVITNCGGTLRRVDAGGRTVYDEVVFGEKWHRRLGFVKLNTLSFEMTEGEESNVFKAVVSGGVASSDTIKNGGIFRTDGTSEITFSIEENQIVATTSHTSVASFVSALGNDTITYELDTEVSGTNGVPSGNINISDFGITYFTNTANAQVVDIDYELNMAWADYIKNLPLKLDKNNGDLYREIERLNQEISSILAGIDELGDAHAKSIDMDELPKVCHYEYILKKSTAPNVAPDFIGQIWMDLTAKKEYHAFGVSSASDFVAIN